jgi:hypothetical protein
MALVVVEVCWPCAAATGEQGDDDKYPTIPHCFFFGGDGQIPVVSTPVCFSTRHWSAVNFGVSARLTDIIRTSTLKHANCNELE